MGAIICELCGSNDITKRDGLFVCQHCGTKYSPEEAKKLVISGTVKVDTSEKLSNLYQIARRAKNDNNSVSAEKYYDMILVEDPMSWEATFYVIYFRALQCKIGEIYSAAASITNGIPSVIELIDETLASPSVKNAAITEVLQKTFYLSQLLQSAAHKHFNDISFSLKEKYRSEAISRSAATVDMLYTLGDSIEALWRNDSTLMKCAITAWQMAIQQHKMLIDILSLFSRAEAFQQINAYEAKIIKYKPEYKAEERLAAEQRLEKKQKASAEFKQNIKQSKKIILALLLLLFASLTFFSFINNAPYRKIKRAIETQTLTYEMCDYGEEGSWGEYLVTDKGNALIASTLTDYHHQDDVESALWFMETLGNFYFDGAPIATSSSFSDWLSEKEDEILAYGYQIDFSYDKSFKLIPINKNEKNKIYVHAYVLSGYEIIK